MEFAQRLTKLQPSPTLALNSKAKQLKASGKKIFNFSAGEPDFATPTAIVERAIDSLKKGKTKYSQPGGQLLLREAVCQKLSSENSLYFKPEEVVVGFGVKEILFHCMLALINDGDEVIVLKPYWVSYIDQIQIAGGTPVIVDVDPQSSDIENISQIQKKLSSKTKAIILNSPNNPSGCIYSHDFLKRLSTILLPTPVWVLSDEIYEYLAFDKPHISLLQIEPKLKERFVLLNGLSKGFAMTGWRVGYAAGPREFIQKVTGLQSHSSTCLPPFIEDAAILALESKKSSMQNEIDELNQRRRTALEILNTIAHIQILSPDGAFYIMVNLEYYLKKSKIYQTSIQISEHLLEKFGIAAVPGEAFGLPNYLRLSYTLSTDELKAGLLEFAKALKEIYEG